MIAKIKLYTKLDALEAQLHESLVPHLEQAAIGKNELIFCVRGFNPSHDLKDKTDKLTEELVEVGAEILSLREKLGEPTEGILAERICWYCREWSKSASKKRRSGEILAKQFLEEISKQDS